MQIIERVLEGYAKLADALHELPDEQLGHPTDLPGWSRGHVLAHIEGVTSAVARQAELEGSPTEMYEGGRPARDEAIERGATRTAAEHRQAVASAVARLGEAWSGVSDWSARVVYRDGTLLDTAHALWREVEIHHRDLLLGPVPWSQEFRDHAVAFLTPRVPDGVKLVLTPADAPGWVLGAGERVELAGAADDLVAWLAGRTPAGELTTTGELPELKPWP